MKMKPMQFFTGKVNDPDKVQRPIAVAIPLDTAAVNAYLTGKLGMIAADATKLLAPE